MEFYFVVTDKSNDVEINAIKQLQPPCLMASYHYFKNKGLKQLIKKIGYKPKIMLDSGAYSAFTQGKEVDLEKYLSFIKDNEPYIDGGYIALDVVQDNEKSFKNYLIMRERGFKPIPVFQYLGDEKVLDRYIADGNKTIALGGTVPIKSKDKVAEWVRLVAWLYPEVNFHLLGSASRRIIDHCDISSADSSTWIMGAIVGRPRHIEGKCVESRTERAIYNMKTMMNLIELT